MKSGYTVHASRLILVLLLNRDVKNRSTVSGSNPLLVWNENTTVSQRLRTDIYSHHIFELIFKNLWCRYSVQSMFYWIMKDESLPIFEILIWRLKFRIMVFISVVCCLLLASDTTKTVAQCQTCSTCLSRFLFLEVLIIYFTTTENVDSMNVCILNVFCICHVVVLVVNV